MRERIINEIIIIASLVILLILLVNPWRFWMPDTLTYAAIGSLLVLVGLFAGVSFRGSPEDEREEAHLSFAAKTGYFSGIAVLLLGVSYELMSGRLDPWLAGALLAMVIGKVVAHAWAKLYK